MSEEVLEIPLDWEVITLGELNTLKSRTLLPESFPEEIFEYYSIPDYQNGELPGRVPGKSIASAKLVLKPRSVLFGKLNPRVEKVWRVGPQSGLRQIGSTEWIPVLPDDRMDPDFLFFLQWSDHVMPKAKTMVSGSTPSRQRVDPTSFYKIRVPLPPLPEQRRIAHVLSTVQEAIAQQEKLIRTTTELKQALMQKLFTEGLRGEPLKETEIGMVPESWGIVSVGQLFYTQLGKMLSPKARTGSEPKPYLRNKNVQWDGIDTDDLYLMDFDDREMEKFRLEPGDLLVCEGGEVGRTALWRGAIEECYYQKALHRLRPRDGSIRPAFMAYWMRYAFQMHNIYGVTGTRTTIAHLPEIKLTPLTVPLPSIEEQDKMLAVLEGTDEKLDHTRHKLIALQALFRTLLHELMTGKVSVGEMN